MTLEILLSPKIGTVGKKVLKIHQVFQVKIQLIQIIQFFKSSIFMSFCRRIHSVCVHFLPLLSFDWVSGDAYLWSVL